MVTTININPPVAAKQSDDIKNRRGSKQNIDRKEVFPQSVASGDPSTKGAILWTRIEPDIHEEEAKPLIVEVSDDMFNENCWSRLIEPDEITEEHDYTIKVDVDASQLPLNPNHWYEYRFEYNGVQSRIGRFRTLPDNGTRLESITFAVTTCQNYVNGSFRAYEALLNRDKNPEAEIDNVDYLLDLGDFVYETIQRPPGSETYPEHTIEELPSGSEVALDLEDYRYLYQRYRSDSHLQCALEQYTRISIWDDHEIANEIYWDYNENCPRAPDHPFYEQPELMRRLVRDALKAWTEYTPTRVTENPNPGGLHEAVDLYQAFQFGDLVTLIRTDERLRKSRPPATMWRHRIRDFIKDGGKWLLSGHPEMRRCLRDGLDRRQDWANKYLPNWVKKRFQYWLPLGFFDDYPGSTMLGTKQRNCFFKDLEESSTIWTVWMNEVLTLHLWLYLPWFDLHNHDAWDGYYGERKEIMEAVKKSKENREKGIQNFITLTGDMHSHLAGYQRRNPFWGRDLLTIPLQGTKIGDRQFRQCAVGVELMTPGVTSVNIAEKIAEGIVAKIGLGGMGETATCVRQQIKPQLVDAIGCVVSSVVPRTRPHIRHFNSHNWGYAIITFTQNECQHQTYAVDKTIPQSRGGEDDRILNDVRIPNGEMRIIPPDDLQ